MLSILSGLGEVCANERIIVLELPVAVYHPTTLPPPPLEPYPYPAPDLFSGPHPIHNSSTSTSQPILYADHPLSCRYMYPSPPPAVPLLPNQLTLHGHRSCQLVCLFRAHPNTSTNISHTSSMRRALNEESGLDALERRLAEQVGLRKPLPLPSPDLHTALDLGFDSPLCERCTGRTRRRR